MRQALRGVGTHLAARRCGDHDGARQSRLGLCADLARARTAAMHHQLLALVSRRRRPEARQGAAGKQCGLCKGNQPSCNLWSAGCSGELASGPTFATVSSR